MSIITADRYHDISCGHRVYGHESKCAHLHGHNYRVHFKCLAKPGLHSLDELGRVIDFGVIKSALCMPMEEMWDHKMLMWVEDPWCRDLLQVDDTIVELSFNPTAENLANYLLRYWAPIQLRHTDVQLIQVKIEETRKCSAVVSLDPREEPLLLPEEENSDVRN